MTSAPCPKCDDPVSLPDHASPQATVRCPLCQETFAIGEILASLPPALIVVDDPGREDEPSEPVVVGEGLAAAASSAGGTEATAAAEPFSIQSRTAAAPAASTAARKGRTAYRPRPRKQKNAFVEVVKIVLGGVAGLVIAQLILWWMPFQNLRRDFGVGPKVAKVLPWVVPERFRGEIPPEAEPDPAGDDGPAKAKPAAKARAAKPPTAKPAGPQDNPDRGPSGLPERRFVEPGSPVGVPGDGGPAALPSWPDEGSQEAAADPFEDPFGPSGDLSIELDLPDDDEAGDPLQALVPEESSRDAADLPEGISRDLEMLDRPVDGSPGETPDEPRKNDRPQNAPRTSPAEVTLTLEDAQAAVTKWNGLSGEQLREQFEKTYAAIGRAGETLAWCEELAGNEREQAAELLRAVASDADKHKILARGTLLLWLNQEDRPNQGLLAAGRVQSIRPLGDRFVSEVQIEGDERTIAVVSAEDPAAVRRYQPGDQVLILGAQVDRSGTEFSGYDGDAAALVWYGASIIRP